MLVITVKKVVFLLVALLCCVKFAKGQNNQFAFATGAAIDVSNFQWSIAGNLEGKSPNILSELVFKKITSLGFYFDGTYKPLKYLELNGYYQRNDVVSGNGTDADYQNDNRTNVSYKEPFSSNKGQLEIFGAGGNFYFLCKGNLKFKSGISYVSTTQNFQILNADFGNLNSTYSAKWQSARLLAGGSYKVIERLSVWGSLSYSLIKYSSKANWNLIEIFRHPVSFEQHATGYGAEGEIGLNYMFNSLFTLTMSGDAGRRKIYKGIDRSYLQNNNQIVTRFNGSNDSYYGFKIGGSVAF